MNLRKIQQLLAAEILWGEEVLDQVEPLCACGSDLMSDVLAFTKEKTLLLTGLTNAQVIRTAEMIDLSGIIFVRGKRPSKNKSPWAGTYCAVDDEIAALRNLWDFVLCRFGRL